MLSKQLNVRMLNACLHARAMSTASANPKKVYNYSKLRRTDKRRQFIDETIRVDHAGELGALRIYQGQLAVLTRLPNWWSPGVNQVPADSHKSETPIQAINHMLEQERGHLEKFEKYMHQYQARPTLLAPLWGAAGYAAGAVSAVMGEKTAMALTISIEEVIQEHYNDQIRALHELKLKDVEPELRQTLVQFRDDEAEHCETGIEYHGLEAPLYDVFSKIVKTGCGLVIKVAEKI